MKREQTIDNKRENVLSECLDFIIEHLVNRGVQREAVPDLYDVLKATKLLKEYVRQHYGDLLRLATSTGWTVLEVITPETLDSICDDCRLNASNLGELGHDWLPVAGRLVDAWQAYRAGADMSVLRVPVVIDGFDACLGDVLYGLQLVGEFGDVRADRGQAVRNVAAFLECVENIWLKRSVHPYDVCRNELLKRLEGGFVPYGSGSACRNCNSIQG